MGLFDELKKLTHTYEDEDEEYEDDYPDVKKPDNTAALFDDRRSARAEERRSNKVVNIHATTRSRSFWSAPSILRTLPRLPTSSRANAPWS